MLTTSHVTPLRDLIGLPWVAGAFGPDAYDCWGLFVAVQRDHFGRQLPMVDVDPNHLRSVIRAFNRHPERESWVPVAHPEPGDGVLIRRQRMATHVGVWVEIDGEQGLLHSAQAHGVVFQAKGTFDLKSEKIVGYFRHSQSPGSPQS